MLIFCSFFALMCSNEKKVTINKFDEKFYTSGKLDPCDCNTKAIDFVTIMTTGNGQDYGDTQVIQGGAGASNSTRAIFAGGYIVPAKGNI